MDFIYGKKKKVFTPELIEKLCGSKFIYLVLVSMISSDNILTEEDAINSLSDIDDFETALKDAKVEDEMRAKVQDYLNKGRDILNADIKRFRGEIKD